MKFNVKAQYGLLFVLYLSHAGRATSQSASIGLGLSKAFLDQVARKLRLAGLIKSVRGYGGGYEVVGTPSVEDVLEVLSPVSLVSKKEATKYLVGSPEERAFLSLCKCIQGLINPALKRKIVNVGKESVATELSELNNPSPSQELN